MQNCEICTRKMWQSSQYWTDKQRWWQCRNCEHWQLEVPPQGLKLPPKILYVDIETALMNVLLYDLYVPGKRINRSLIVRHSYVINWAAAWLDTDYNIKGRIFSEVVTPKEARRCDDKRILKDLFYLMEESDYIAGHNSNAFDVKKLKWRFMVHQMGYPLESKRLDTFTLAGRNTKPPSRALESLSLALGGTHKKGLDVQEWIDIVQTGEQRLLRKADIYCRGDVRNGVLVLQQYAKAIEQSGRRILL